MSFLTDVLHSAAGTLGLGPARGVHTSTGDVGLVSDVLVQSATGPGLYDALRYGVDQAVTPEEMDRAYRAIVGTLVQFRGDVIGAHLAGLRAQHRSGPEADWEDVPHEHNWARLLARPNAYTPRLDLYSALSQIADLQGDAALVVERGRRVVGRTAVDDVPVALHLVWPELGRAYPVLAETGGPAGYVLWLRDGQTFPLSPRDVVRIRAVHPLAPYRSASLVDMARAAIESDRAGDEYARDTLRDRGLPDVVLKVEETLKGEAGQKRALDIGRLFAKTYRSGRRDRVAISHPGLQIEPLSMNARDMRVPEIREATKERLHLVLKVHEGLFAKDATRANAEAAERGFAKLVVLPTVARYAGQIEFGLELAHGADPDRLRLQLPEGIVPRDEAQRLRNDRLRIETGTPVNVVLSERGDEPVGPEGDVALVALGLRPLSAVAEVAPLATGPAAGVATEAPPPAGRGQRARLPGPSRSFTAADEAALREALERATDPVQVAALRFIYDLADQASAALRAASDVDALAADGVFFDDDAWDEAWRRVLLPALEAATRAGYAAGGVAASAVTGTVPAFDDSFFGARPRLADALGRTLSGATSVPRTLREAVERALAEGAAAGEGPDGLADRVSAKIRGEARARSNTIARTSGKAVAERAAMEAYLDAGCTRHRWVSVFAVGTRASHAAQNGAVVKIGDPFPNGLTHPADPAGPVEEVVNCLCYVAPEADDSEDLG